MKNLDDELDAITHEIVAILQITELYICQYEKDIFDAAMRAHDHLTKINDVVRKEWKNGCGRCGLIVSHPDKYESSKLITKHLAKKHKIYA